MNKPLSPNQIQELFDYTERMHIRYKDVQFEIVDHLASGVEELMSKDNNLTFSKALYDYTGTMPHSFFSDIITSKEKSLEKLWRKKFVFYLLGFFTIPRGIITLLLFSSFYLMAINLPELVLLIGLLVLTALLLIWYFSFRTTFTRDNEKEYLLFRTYLQAVEITYLLFCNLPLNIIIFARKGVLDSQLGLLFICATITSFILFTYASIHVFPKMLQADLDNKYAHLNLKMT